MTGLTQHQQKVYDRYPQCRAVLDRVRNKSIEYVAAPRFVEKPKPLLRSLPLAKQCQHNTGINGTTKAGCGACTTYGCKVKGTVKLSDCAYCTSHETPTVVSNHSQNVTHENPALIAGYSWRSPVRFDHFNLHPDVIGMRFNASIIESGDGYLYAFRNGWQASMVFICRLDRDFKPIGECKLLGLGSKAATVGREDPRLFRLNGKLHVWYIGYCNTRTNVLFARINEETLTVEDKFFPMLKGRDPVEKNWAHFDYHGVAHAVYDTQPEHRIIRIEGGQADWAYSTPFAGKFSGGKIRGGASPVLHDGHYWHFFHAAITQTNGRRRYSTGVLLFEPEPPFKVVKYTPHPIDMADIGPKQIDTHVDCLFVGGAIYQDGMWITANGIDDRYSEIRFYDHAMIQSQLEDTS